MNDQAHHSTWVPMQQEPYTPMSNSNRVQNVQLYSTFTSPVNQSCFCRTGRPCHCSIKTADMSTQTEGLDYLKETTDQNLFFKRGSFQHTLVQRKISDVVTKYNLQSKRQLEFGVAVIEVMTSFPGMEMTTETRNKMSERVAKAIRWKKYKAKKTGEKPAAKKTAEEENPAVPPPNNEILVEQEYMDSDSDDDLVLSNIRRNIREKEL